MQGNLGTSRETAVLEYCGKIRYRIFFSYSCWIKLLSSTALGKVWDWLSNENLFLGLTTKYLLKYTLFWFQIYVRAIILITKYNHKISTSFMKNNKRYNRLNTAEWISISTTFLSADWLKYERKITLY